MAEFQNLAQQADIWEQQLISYFDSRLREQFHWLGLPNYVIKVDMDYDPSRMAYHCRVRIDDWVQSQLIADDILRQGASNHRDLMDSLFQSLTRQTGAAFFSSWIDRVLDKANDIEALMAFRSNIKDHIEEVEFRGEWKVGPGTLVSMRLKDTLFPFTMTIQEIESEPRVAISKILMMVA